MCGATIIIVVVVVVFLVIIIIFIIFIIVVVIFIKILSVLITNLQETSSFHFIPSTPALVKNSLHFSSTTTDTIHHLHHTP